MYFDSANARVPATTANLGPWIRLHGGRVGRALDRRPAPGLGALRSCSWRGGGVASPNDESNLVYRAAAAFYERTGVSAPPLRVRCVNRIPLRRGLGSSAAAIVGGFGAANALEGSPLTPEQVFQACAEIEGHPDNVAPALFGGFQIVARDGGAFVRGAIKAKRGLKAMVFIPTYEVVTKEARAVLPKEVVLEDAVHNVSRASPAGPRPGPRAMGPPGDGDGGPAPSAVSRAPCTRSRGALSGRARRRRPRRSSSPGRGRRFSRWFPAIPRRSSAR